MCVGGYWSTDRTTRRVTIMGRKLQSIRANEGLEFSDLDGFNSNTGCQRKYQNLIGKLEFALIEVAF